MAPAAIGASLRLGHDGSESSSSSLSHAPTHSFLSTRFAVRGRVRSPRPTRALCFGFNGDCLKMCSAGVRLYGPSVTVHKTLYDFLNEAGDRFRVRVQLCWVRTVWPNRAMTNRPIHKKCLRGLVHGRGVRPSGRNAYRTEDWREKHALSSRSTRVFSLSVPLDRRDKRINETRRQTWGKSANLLSLSFHILHVVARTASPSNKKYPPLRFFTNVSVPAQCNQRRTIESVFCSGDQRQP
jgi:hypothetical protein